MSRKGGKSSKPVDYSDTPTARKLAGEFRTMTKELADKALRVIHEAMPAKVITLSTTFQVPTSNDASCDSIVWRCANCGTH